jgi:hypothetical protein
MAKAEWLDTLEGDLTVETIQGGSLYIPSHELSDPEEEKKKLSAEKERLEQELARSKESCPTRNSWTKHRRTRWLLRKKNRLLMKNSIR